MLDVMRMPPTSTAVLQVDEWLFERKPAVDLADTLVCAWRGDLGDLRTPLPDECLDLFWVADGSMWLSGPETRSWTPGPAQTGNAVGIRFRPGVGPPILGLAASAVRDARIGLHELWGDRQARLLAERVALQPDDRARVRELENVVRRLVVDARPVDEVAAAVAVGLGQRRPTSVRELARLTGLSERQIHRRCTAAFGYGPAALLRVLRVRRVLRLARSPERDHGLAGLAATAGYFDQQHLTHEIRDMFGTTPTKLLRVSGVRSIQDRSA
jgi:AraC-like DNA-binding protein